MSQLTAKQIRSVAMSVSTAKKLGIKTQVANTGPQILNQAEKILAGMITRANKATPSAPSVRYEGIYYRLSGMAAAYAGAVAELKNALEGY